MRFINFLLIALVLSLYSVTTAAQNPQIYVVDMQKVLDKSNAGAAALKIVEKSVNAARDKIEKHQRDLTHLGEDYQKQVALLSESAKQEKQDQLIAKKKSIQRMIADQKESVGKSKAKEIEKVVSNARKIITELATQGEYPIVIEQQAKMLVYVDPNFDLSGKVIAELNKRF